MCGGTDGDGNVVRHTTTFYMKNLELVTEMFKENAHFILNVKLPAARYHSSVHPSRVSCAVLRGSLYLFPRRRHLSFANKLCETRPLSAPFAKRSNREFLSVSSFKTERWSSSKLARPSFFEY